MPSSHLILILLPLIFPSSRVFSNESALHIRWPKYWSFSFNISPSNEHPGLISFRMDWLDLFAVQGTLKSLLQHHSPKASLLQHSAFFIVQLSHLYTTTGKTIALTRRSFVDKVMSLLFNMLSRLVITFLPRNKYLLISWLQSPSTMILEPPKNSQPLFPLFPTYLPWSDGTRCNLISGSSAFSKCSLNIWKYTAQVLLKPGLENFEHYFVSVCDECNCAAIWTFLALPLSFSILWPLLSFPNLLAYWVQHFHSIIF